MKIPVIKKKISSFLTKEDGRISKENILKAGVVAAVLGLGAATSAKSVFGIHTRNICPQDCEDIEFGVGTQHQNELVMDKTDSTVQATHQHCLQTCHSQHTSHSHSW